MNHVKLREINRLAEKLAKPSHRHYIISNFATLNMKLRNLALLVFISSLPFAGNSQSLAFNLQPKNPSCFGFSDGGANVVITSGSGHYSFKWDNLSWDSCTIRTLGAGGHRVTVTDLNTSERTSINFTLTNPSKLNADSVGQAVPTCYGTEITIAATGGTSPYTGTGTFNSPAGNYVYVVSDANGCTDTVPVSVSAAPTIKVHTTILDTACYNGLAHVIVTATGGHGPYQYSSSAPRTYEPYNTSVAGGLHYFFVYDSLGCPGIDTVMIPQYAKTNVTITGDTATSCSSDSTLICVVNPQSNFTYTWNTGQNSTCMYAKTAGNVYVNVIDGNRCAAQSNRIKISKHALPSVSVSISGDTLRAYDAVAYQWLQNNTPIEGAIEQVYVAKQTGSYAVDITDSNGCHATSGTVNVEVTGINDINDERLSIYPNPSIGGLYKLTVANSMIGAMAYIYDVSGKLIYQTEITHNTATIAVDAPAGVYILRIPTGENMLVRKLVKE